MKMNAATKTLHMKQQNPGGLNGWGAVVPSELLIPGCPVEVLRGIGRLMPVLGRWLMDEAVRGVEGTVDMM